VVYGRIFGISGTLVACGSRLEAVWNGLEAWQGVPEMFLVEGCSGVANAPRFFACGGVVREGVPADMEVGDDVFCGNAADVCVGQTKRHPCRTEGVEDELDRSADAVEGLVLVLDLDRVEDAKHALLTAALDGFEWADRIDGDEDVAVVFGLDDEHVLLLG